MYFVITLCVATLIGGAIADGGPGNFMASTPLFSFQGQNILWPAGQQGIAGISNPSGLPNIFNHPFFSSGAMPGMPHLGSRPGEPIEASSPSCPTPCQARGHGSVAVETPVIHTTIKPAAIATAAVVPAAATVIPTAHCDIPAVTSSIVAPSTCPCPTVVEAAPCSTVVTPATCPSSVIATTPCATTALPTVTAPCSPVVTPPACPSTVIATTPCATAALPIASVPCAPVVTPTPPTVAITPCTTAKVVGISIDALAKPAKAEVKSPLCANIKADAKADAEPAADICADVSLKTPKTVGISSDACGKPSVVVDVPVCAPVKPAPVVDICGCASPKPAPAVDICASTSANLPIAADICADVSLKTPKTVGISSDASGKPSVVVDVPVCAPIKPAPVVDICGCASPKPAPAVDICASTSANLPIAVAKVNAGQAANISATVSLNASKTVNICGDAKLQTPLSLKMPVCGSGGLFPVVHPPVCSFPSYGFPPLFESCHTGPCMSGISFDAPHKTPLGVGILPDGSLNNHFGLGLSADACFNPLNVGVFADASIKPTVNVKMPACASVKLDSGVGKSIDGKHKGSAGLGICANALPNSPKTVAISGDAKLQTPLSLKMPVCGSGGFFPVVHPPVCNFPSYSFPPLFESYHTDPCMSGISFDASHKTPLGVADASLNPLDVDLSADASVKPSVRVKIPVCAVVKPDSAVDKSVDCKAPAGAGISADDKLNTGLAADICAGDSANLFPFSGQHGDGFSSLNFPTLVESCNICPYNCSDLDNSLTAYSCGLSSLHNVPGHGIPVHSCDEYKPHDCQCPNLVPLGHNVDTCTHHIPIFENHVGTQQESRICQIPILKQQTHNVIDEATQHIPITNTRIVPVLQSCLNHVPVTHHYRRPIVESSSSHVYDGCADVVESTVRNVPAYESEHGFMATNAVPNHHIGGFRNHLYLPGQDLYGQQVLPQDECVGPCQSFEDEQHCQDYQPDVNDNTVTAPLAHCIPFPEQNTANACGESKGYPQHPDYCE